MSPMPVSLDLVTATDARYDEARLAWNRFTDQKPHAVVVAHAAHEVASAVRYARDNGLRVALQGTGHNAHPLGDLSDTLLVRTSPMRRVTVVPSAQLVRVEAGALWSDVVYAAAPHGLVALSGSAHDVGVVGYTLGGGLSWLARSHGLSANSVLAAEVVTADGRAIRVDATNEPDLFWALRGGGGSFAAVTALELRLFPLREVTVGALFFPFERTGEVLHAWREWVPGLPEELTSCAHLVNLPDDPEVPEPLRGKAFAVLELVHQAPVSETDALLAPLRALGPVLDTVKPGTPADILALHMDPPGPVPCTGDGMVLSELPAEAADALLAEVGPGTDSPMVSVEVRHLGGALGRTPADAGALAGLPGQFLLFSVGITTDAESASTVRRRLARIEAAMAPWRAERDYLNLRETSDDPARFHAPEALARLRAVKQTYDPTDLFRANHPVTPTE